MPAFRNYFPAFFCFGTLNRRLVEQNETKTLYPTHQNLQIVKIRLWKLPFHLVYRQIVSVQRDNLKCSKNPRFHKKFISAGLSLLRFAEKKLFVSLLVLIVRNHCK